MSVRRLLVVVMIVTCLGAVALAQEEIPLQPWIAPPYWAPPAPQAATEDATIVPGDVRALDAEALPTEPLPFIAVTPCRLIDTRNPAGTYGGPPLAAGVPRSFPVAGQCGVATTAGAVSINATVVNTQGPGFVAFYPEGGTFPGVSNVNYTAAWQTVANAAVVPLGPGGFTALAGVSGTDLIVDVNGYYAPEGVRSVFGRTGAVVATAGDYTASQVTNVPAGGISATDVQGALDDLDSGKAGIVHSHTGSELVGLAPGGITFGDASGHLGQNAGKLFWDDAANWLKIGESAPMAWLDLNGILRMPATTAIDGYPQTGVVFLGVESFLHGYGSEYHGWNTFVGQGAGNFTMGGPNMGDGGSNTAVGYWSLHANTTGHGNTAVGSHALLTNAGGMSNTAVGASSMLRNTSGWANTATGTNSLWSNTSGTSNTAIGHASLGSNSSGDGNTGLGFGSLEANTTGSHNTASGYGSLSLNDTGEGNTASGWYSLRFNLVGSWNTAVGFDSLELNTGSSNIALGSFAGKNLTTGSYNIDVGNEGVAGDANTIRIGDGHHYRTFVAGIRGVTPGVPDGQAVIIDSNGQLGTSTTVGAVTSVFGRTGAVAAQAGDYSAAQVANAPAGNIVATTAQAAIGELDAEKAPVSHTHAGSDITSAVANATEAVNADTVDGLHASAFVQGETVVVKDDDFERGPEYRQWSTAATGTGSVGINSGVAVVVSNGGGVTVGSATLWGTKQFPLSSGTLIFKALVQGYPDSAVLGDGQPRGLANGADRDNAIEFVSETLTSVKCRTVSNGTATETSVPLGHSVYVWTEYQIVATPASVKFYVDGDFVASHATNIPTTPLNLYFESQCNCLPDTHSALYVEQVSLERRF